MKVGYYLRRNNYDKQIKIGHTENIDREGENRRCKRKKRKG